MTSSAMRGGFTGRQQQNGWRGLACVATWLIAACAESPAPAYLRLDAPAPALPGVPAHGAQLVVFWASWCAPCREEAPSLRKLADKPPPGLTVVVLGHDESPAAVRRFFGGEPPASWRFRPDEGRGAARAFGVDTLPSSTLVVGGRAVARFDGPRDWDSRAMRRLLQRLVESAEPGARRR